MAKNRSKTNKECKSPENGDLKISRRSKRPKRQKPKKTEAEELQRRKTSSSAVTGKKNRCHGPNCPSSSRMDIQPLKIDKSINFDSIGGLDHHMDKLKKLFFPFLKPELFRDFGISPPSGVIFYGPPGTGKTMVARALSNEFNRNGGVQITFFSVKGSDFLSKYFGESEQRLNAIFKQARLKSPSIIFLDEIDGIAPARNCDHSPHFSSIVSTLLALMDGVESKGDVFVIGATNRLDAIDPALRRPGRFDREFKFELPDRDARYQILKIHTRNWKQVIPDKLIQELSDNTVGYCGADLRALCTETVLNAFIRSNPSKSLGELLRSRSRPRPIKVCPEDFHHAMTEIIPSSRRNTKTIGHK